MPPPGVEPGDYVVVRTRSMFGYLIRLFTRCPYDHAVLVTGPGEITEAKPSGVRTGSLTEYAGCRAAANTGDTLTHAQRAIIVAKAKTVTGDEYGFADIAVIGLRLLGFRWGWLRRVAADRDALICSELVCEAGLAAGLVSWQCGEPDPAFVTPADLAARPAVHPVRI
jgi:uncharacterized protein YycO